MTSCQPAIAPLPTWFPPRVQKRQQAADLVWVERSQRRSKSSNCKPSSGNQMVTFSTARPHRVEGPRHGDLILRLTDVEPGRPFFMPEAAERRLEILKPGQCPILLRKTDRKIEPQNQRATVAAPQEQAVYESSSITYWLGMPDGPTFSYSNCNAHPAFLRILAPVAMCNDCRSWLKCHWGFRVG